MPNGEDLGRPFTTTDQGLLQQIAAQESRQSRSGKLVIAALVAALGGGGLSGATHFFNEGDKENIKSAVAEKLAILEERQTTAKAEIEKLRTNTQALREAVIKLQAAVEYSMPKARDRTAEIADLLRTIGMHVEVRETIPSIDMQEYRSKLFKE